MTLQLLDSATNFIHTMFISAKRNYKDYILDNIVVKSRETNHQRYFIH